MVHVEPCLKKERKMGNKEIVLRSLLVVTVFDIKEYLDHDDLIMDFDKVIENIKHISWGDANYTLVDMSNVLHFFDFHPALEEKLRNLVNALATTDTPVYFALNG